MTNKIEENKIAPIKRKIISSTIDPIISNQIKKNINFGFNGLSAGINLATAISGNVLPGNTFHESLEWLSSGSMRLATASQGVVAATIAYEKKNLITLLGALAELPIAVIAPWFNFFLHRGPAIGANLYEGVIGNMDVDVNGEAIRYEDFNNIGWIKGAGIMISQIPKLLKEIVTKPFEKEGLFPRWSFFFSSGMIIGPILHYLGLGIGAPFRDFMGGAEAIALMTHSHDSSNANDKNSETPNANPKKLSIFSNYFWSGVVWTAGAATDYVKRIPILEDAISNWTELSLSLDRLGSIFYILGNQGTDKHS